MIKKLCIFFLAAITAGPLWAQPEKAAEDCDALFAPVKKQWQISMVLGNGTFFRQLEGMNYLLPAHGATSVGLPGTWLYGDAAGNQSGDPGMFLNLGTIGENSLVNIAGVQVKYFLNNYWSIHAMFSMNINLTPKKDFTEGDFSVPEMPVPSYKYIEGRMTNSWMANIGTDRYFRTRNERIQPYLGIMAGFQMCRLETNTPFTGEQLIPGVPGDPVLPDNALPKPPETDIPGRPVEVYRGSHRNGQIWGAQGGLTAGIEFSLMQGLVLGFEVQPVAYQYTRIQIKPAGMAPFEAENHNFRLFTMPCLKLGMRFSAVKRREKKKELPPPRPVPVIKAEEPKAEVHTRVEVFRRDIFFKINSTVISREEEKKIVEFAEFLKKYPDSKITVTGYADAKTGTAEINRRLSQERAGNVAGAMKKNGIDAARIEIDYKGDSVQLFSDPEKNQCVTIRIMD